MSDNTKERKGRRRQNQIPSCSFSLPGSPRPGLTASSVPGQPELPTGIPPTRGLVAFLLPRCLLPCLIVIQNQLGIERHRRPVIPDRSDTRQSLSLAEGRRPARSQGVNVNRSQSPRTRSSTNTTMSNHCIPAIITSGCCSRNECEGSLCPIHTPLEWCPCIAHRRTPASPLRPKASSSRGISGDHMGSGILPITQQ